MMQRSPRSKARGASSVPAPRFFANARAFRSWLEHNAATATELIVGFHKVDSGRASMTWSESVDEALCFGWIDGVRKRIDDEAYQIRFTPRKPSSIWSAVNIAKFEQLTAAGRMTPAGDSAYRHRKETRSRVYAYEQAEAARFSPQERREFERAREAWIYFESTPPSYRKVILHWVTSAKKEATRASRFASVLEACNEKRRLR
jgi:uncharacterized protein YdeI (YjbR/CyaY-like superfamily)